MCICIESQITNDASNFRLATFVESTCKCWKRKLYKNSTFQFLVFQSMKVPWPLQILMNKIFWYTNAKLYIKQKRGTKKEKNKKDNKFIIKIKAYNIQNKKTQTNKHPLPPKKNSTKKKKTPKISHATK